MSDPHGTPNTAASRVHLPAKGPLLTRGGWSAFMMALIAVCALAPVLNLWVPEGSMFHMSTYVVALLGKIMCYAICALAMDLIWGYTGILSLGHGVFFALGGYTMGMYLMRQIGRDGNYKSDLPDFMVFLDWKVLPWHWTFSDSFCGDAVPHRRGAGHRGLCVRLLRLSLAHQGCVFFHHHPGHDLCGHAAVLPQRDRLRRQQRLYRLQAHFEHPAGHAFDAHGAVCADGPDAAGLLFVCQMAGGQQVRPRAAGDTRRGNARDVLGLQPAGLQAHDLGDLGRDVRRGRGAVCAAGRHHQPRAR